MVGHASRCVSALSHGTWRRRRLAGITFRRRYHALPQDASRLGRWTLVPAQVGRARLKMREHAKSWNLASAQVGGFTFRRRYRALPHDASRRGRWTLVPAQVGRARLKMRENAKSLDFGVGAGWRVFISFALPIAIRGRAAVPPRRAIRAFSSAPFPDATREGRWTAATLCYGTVAGCAAWAAPTFAHQRSASSLEVAVPATDACRWRGVTPAGRLGLGLSRRDSAAIQAWHGVGMGRQMDCLSISD